MSGMKMTEMNVKLTFIEDLLGGMAGDADVHAEFIASNAPCTEDAEEEVAAVAAIADDEDSENSTRLSTVFAKDEDGAPFLFDYQIKGFFKDACSSLRRVSGSVSSKITAHKKIIDGCIFIKQRKVPINLSADMDTCVRPLRASTTQGERVTLCSSEAAPAGSTIEFTIQILTPAKVAIEDAIVEWLDYGQLRGIGNWRNSGKGRFEWELLD